MTVWQPPIDEAAPLIRRILVATDFSESARRAVSRAAQLAHENDAHLHIVHAQPDWDLFSKSGSANAAHYREVAEHAERALGEELAFVEGRFKLRVTGETRTGRASEVLRSTMAAASPHLVVAGARGEHDSGTLSAFLGGTALKLAAFSECPVLIVRNAGEEPYRVSLAAVEGSGASALLIVRWARALARKGECHLVHAFDAPYVARLRQRGVADETIRACTEEARQSATHFVDEVLNACGEAGQSLNAHLVCGEPVSAMLRELTRCNPDVAVVGRHEHPPRELHLKSFGSVALRIAYHATCDVLVVP
jgi:nucleotide-binding universal stress UspA family protein